MTNRPADAPVSEADFRPFPFGLNLVFFLALAGVIAPLGVRRANDFTWKLLVLWIACVAVLEAIALTRWDALL
jgi:hypothetical protein